MVFTGLLFKRSLMNTRLFQSLFLKPWISLIQKKHIRVVALKPNKDLAYINQLYEAGKLRAVIDGPYRLDEIQRVLTIFLKAGHKGKMVITL